MKRIKQKDLAQIFAMQVAAGNTNDFKMNELCIPEEQMSEDEKIHAEELKKDNMSHLIGWNFNDEDFALSNPPIEKRKLVNELTGEKAAVGPIVDLHGVYNVNGTELIRGDFIVVPMADNHSSNITIIKQKEFKSQYVQTSNI